MKNKQSWYRIAAQDSDKEGGHAEIFIYGQIGLDWWGEGIAAETLVKELADLEAETIDVRINSVGGVVFEGLAIYNAFVRHPAKVTTHVDGMAASIASIVALAGNDVRIAENAFMMIHNPWGVEIGDANDMRKMADILDTLAGSLVDTYTAKTGESEKVIRGMMDEETWFNASEAEELGLVDNIDARMEIAAAFDLSRFHNAPEGALQWGSSDTVPRRRPGSGMPPPVVVDWEAVEAAVQHFAAAATFKSAPAAVKPPAAGPDPEVAQVALEWERTLARMRT